MAATKHVWPGKAQYEGGEIAAKIVLAETNQLKTGGGRVHGILVIDAGTFDVILYDDPDSNDNLVIDFDSSAWGIGWHPINLPFGLGIRAVTSGTPGDLIIVYS
jgi:hypothetical protein